MRKELSIEDIKPRLNILDDEFDIVIGDLLIASQEFVKDAIHENVDLTDPMVKEVQHLWILGAFDERQTQYRNFLNTQISTLQIKYRRRERLASIPQPLGDK